MAAAKFPFTSPRRSRDGSRRPFTTLTEARLALSRIKPTDAPNDQTTLENFLSNLASEARVAKVIFAGANALAAPVPARIHPIAVGDAVANGAIGSFISEARSPWRGGPSCESDDRQLQSRNAHARSRRDRRRQGSRPRERSARRARDRHARISQRYRPRGSTRRNSRPTTHSRSTTSRMRPRAPSRTCRFSSSARLPPMRTG